MESQARIVIVGGGIMGVGLLYHLAEGGAKDVLLIEKGELTSGSTWHAAGQCPNLVGNYNLAKIHECSVALYSQLERLTGQAVGWHGCGSIRFALTERRPRLVPLSARNRRQRRLPHGNHRRRENWRAKPFYQYRRCTRRRLDRQRRPCRPVGPDPGHGAGSARKRRENRAQQPGDGNQFASQAANGKSSPRRERSSRKPWSTPRAASPGRSRKWWERICPSAISSTTIWFQAMCPN